MVMVIIAGHIDLSVGSVVGAHRRGLGGAHGQPARLPVAARACSLALVVGVADRRLAGLLGRLRRHPGVHRDPGRHAAVPRRSPCRCSATRASAPFPDAVRTLPTASSTASWATSASARSAAPTCSRLLLGAGRGRRLSRVSSGAPARPGIGYQQTGRAARRCSSLEDRRRRPRSSCSSSCSWPAFKDLPCVLIILAVLVLGYALLTNRAVFGRHIYAIGGNLQAATLSGVKVKSVNFWIFVNMGVLAALAGVIFAARLNQAEPDRRQHRSSSTRSRPRSSAARPSRRRRHGRRRDHRRPDHGRDQQRHVAHRGTERAGHAGQGPGAARGGRLRRVEQAPRGGASR